MFTPNSILLLIEVNSPSDLISSKMAKNNFDITSEKIIAGIKNGKDASNS